MTILDTVSKIKKNEEFMEKYKSPHLLLSQKGLKSYKKVKNSVTLKTKESHLMSPQQREVCRRILFKPVREEYGTLNINCCISI